MDPLIVDIKTFNYEYVEINSGGKNKNYCLIDQKPVNYQDGSKPVMLLIHGFPDFSYGWRYEIRQWVKAGYRIIAPDCPGYGGTDKPDDLMQYTPRIIADDMIALMDAMGVGKFILVGHDWGAYMSWRIAAWYPERLIALAIASLPYPKPPHESIPFSVVIKKVPGLGYQEYLASPEAPSEIESRLPLFFSTMYQKTEGDNMERISRKDGEGSLKDVMTHPVTYDAIVSDRNLLAKQELHTYVRTFGDGGMSGPLNYYKTRDLRFEQEKDLPDTLPTNCPVLFLRPLEDPTCSEEVVKAMDNYVQNLKVVVYDCGHWMLVEEKWSLGKTVLDWLGENDVTVKAAEPAKDGRTAKTNRYP